MKPISSNVPTPQGGVPWLVYPRQGINGKQQYFYSIVDGQMKRGRDTFYFQQPTCWASISGWLLLQIIDNSRYLILFNPFSRKLIPLPKFIGEEPDQFVLSSTPGKQDCAIVAGYRRYHRYVLYCRPGDVRWEKCALDIHGNCLIQTIAGCDGKVYLYTSEHLLMIVDFSYLPCVEYICTNMPSHHINLGSLEHVIDLVVFSGELFLIKRISYSNVWPPLFLTLVVLKLDYSSLTWVFVETINDSIFLLGYKFASAFTSSNPKLKGDCIHFLDGNRLYCFDMNYKSLTVSYPCSVDSYKYSGPFWLMQDDSTLQLVQDDSSHGNHYIYFFLDSFRVLKTLFKNYFWRSIPNRNCMDEEKRDPNEKVARVLRSYEIFLFDHPNPLPSPARISNIINRLNVWPSWRPRTPLLVTQKKDEDHPKLPLLSQNATINNIINRHNVWPRWRPETPLLMFTHTNDGTYKLLDPCSKAIYEIFAPGLSNSMILASKGDWLLAENSASPFFINPFSKQRIDLPQIGKMKSRKMAIGATFSSSPVSSDCAAFYIVDGYDRNDLKIFVHRKGEDKWACHICKIGFPSFLLSHSSPVFLNGCVYCLGKDGNLGVFDSTINSWSVFWSAVNIAGKVCNSTLVGSCGKLLSVFTDLYQNPIGVFEFNFDSSRWESIFDLGGRTLFFGRGASVCMIANDEQMKNMICFPAFQRECSFDLMTYPVETGRVTNLCAKPKTEFLSTWIGPGSSIFACY